MEWLNETALADIEALCRARREEILHTSDTVTVTGTVYYVSNEGSDENDGRSPQRPWQTLARVSRAELAPGDGVLFRRGDLFRGFVETRPGVTYAAYGEGEKPRLYGWDRDLADPDLWELFDGMHRIWRLTQPILDCGTLVFDHGNAHCRKLIPSYIGGQFVCREDESRPFDMAAEMTQNLDMVCFYTARMTQKPSHGQDFPVPVIDDQSFGELYLRCDAGNPGEVFSSVEALPKRNLFQIKSNDFVTLDNLCIKYVGAHAIGAGGTCVKGLHVSNCEIGWVGGSVQNYLGVDPNYPQGGRGSVTRYGNGVEIYGGCEDYTVENCYIYQVYDAGITHQITTRGKSIHMRRVKYLNNLVERCVYSIEYFLEKTEGDTESAMEDCEIRGNLLRLSGYGWGQQRHNTDTPAHIKGWSYQNTARNFRICHNLLDRAAYRMIHLVAEDEKSLPILCGNIFVQTEGGCLGQYGSTGGGIPPMLAFDEDVEATVACVIGDREAKLVFAQLPKA